MRGIEEEVSKKGGIWARKGANVAVLMSIAGKLERKEEILGEGAAFRP